MTGAITRAATASKNDTRKESNSLPINLKLKKLWNVVKKTVEDYRQSEVPSLVAAPIMFKIRNIKVLKY